MLVPPERKGFTVYTKSRCSFCDKIKILLEKEKETRTVRFVNCDDILAQPNKKEELLNTFQKWAYGTPVKTFPVVFLDGIYIGGFTNTRALLESLAEKEAAFSF